MVNSGNSIPHDIVGKSKRANRNSLPLDQQRAKRTNPRTMLHSRVPMLQISRKGSSRSAAQTDLEPNAARQRTAHHVATNPKPKMSKTPPANVRGTSEPACKCTAPACIGKPDSSLAKKRGTTERKKAGRTDCAETPMDGLCFRVRGARISESRVNGV